MEQKKLLSKVVFLMFSLRTKSILIASKNYSLATDITWTILMMSSLLHCFDLTVVVPLLSIEGQKALQFHHKYLNLCSEDEVMSYGFGRTWGWVTKDSFHFWVNYPFKRLMVIFGVADLPVWCCIQSFSASCWYLLHDWTCGWSWQFGWWIYTYKL